MLGLDIDIDLVAAIIDDSMPWFQAWAFVLSLVLGAVVVRVAAHAARIRRSPVRRLMRR